MHLTNFFLLLASDYLLFTFSEASKEADVFRQKLLSNEATLEKLQNDFKKASSENNELVKEVRLIFTSVVVYVHLHKVVRIGTRVVWCSGFTPWNLKFR